MKKQLMLLILCLCGTLTFLTAQEGNPNDGYEKFPECRLYNANVTFNRSSNFQEVFEKIGELTSVAAFYDKNSSKFDMKQDNGNDVAYNLLSWSGYLPIKKAGTYTFLVTMSGMNPPHGKYGAFGLKVKDQPLIVAWRDGKLQGTLNVELKPGMAPIHFVVYCSPNARSDVKALIRFKPLNAIGEFQFFTPNDLSHKVAKEDW